jgi:hypothetical protein
MHCDLPAGVAQPIHTDEKKPAQKLVFQVLSGGLFFGIFFGR